MSNCITFTVGEPFPLPIVHDNDGGMFQVDDNGIMFILQLSRSDIVATEAFRTGEIELALIEIDRVLFLLYRIDGIFKDGWGDAPLSLATLTAEHLPGTKSLDEQTIYLYLVDTNLKILLAQRQVDLKLDTDFLEIIKNHISEFRENPLSSAEIKRRILHIYQRLSPAELRARARIVKHIPLDLKLPTA